MQFSWASEETQEGGCEVKGGGGDFTTYENLYGNELQLFESFFNGNINELDYLTDLSLPEGSQIELTSAVPDPALIDMLFVKNEPSSPESFASTEGSSPSSPGESSGPSSPETLFQHHHHHASMMSPGAAAATIDPISLTMPSTAFPSMMGSQQQLAGGGVEVKKQGGGAKRSRTGSIETDNEQEGMDSMSPLPGSNGGLPEEERNVKRQRSSLSRLIKNRESAQKSRLRKKMYIEDLETKVKSLATHNDMLLQENNTLKEEIGYLTKFINKTPGLAEEIAQSRPKGTAPIRNVKAAGVCLLIVLFSFGLFFNNVQQFDNGPALPFEGSAREPIPEVLRFGGQRRYGHMLKSFKDAPVPSLARETEEVGGDLTPIYPKRRLPPVGMGSLESVIQRNKKVGTGLSPYKKIKLEADEMDVVDPSCTEELEKGFISVPQLPACDEDDLDTPYAPRNDTGAETTGYTEN
jgi:hypothetical protein